MQQIKNSPRHIARSLAVQGLYAYQTNCVSANEIIDFLNDSEPDLFAEANYELMNYLLVSGIERFDLMLDKYVGYMNRPMAEVNSVEKAILVVAAIELTSSISVPATVIINEAVELAKLYGGEDGFKFVNGLVDKLANALRHDEIMSYKKK